MNEQRRQILEMLAESKITADEAERLINALERDDPDSPPGTVSRQKRRPKYVRLLMEDNSETPSRINIRVPLQLLRAGVRLTSLIPPQAVTKINEALSKSPVPIDITDLRPQHLEELIEQLDELTVDIDDPDTKLQIFCE